MCIRDRYQRRVRGELKTLFSLSNKVALITGGTGVLGSALAKGLSAAGAKVALLGRNRENAERVAEEIKTSTGGQVLVLIADVLVKDQLLQAKKTLLETFKSLDILVNCAGGNVAGATIPDDKSVFEALNIQDLQKVMDLNFMGTVLPTQIFGEIFASQNSGVIVNISSMAASRALTRVCGYSASKAAVDNYTRWMAVELAKKLGEGVRVNAIAPGFFLADQNRKLLIKEDGSYTDRGNSVIRNTPMNRFGNPEELVGTLVWLCSDASKFVTGVVVAVDGGFSAFSGV
eukprot:TRINITY_DN2617_c0_g1_i1.p1 TRINITY_DN2617_c0_g1~~TRINITY_DN2617_c0_g1_i1.p1  ORF type:complete len:288 (+),score=55.92 TRINITY_DN2617_c0_g1_i1:3-866(+)